MLSCHVELISLQFPKSLPTLRTFSSFWQHCPPHWSLSCWLLGISSQMISQSVPRRWFTWQCFWGQWSGGGCAESWAKDWPSFPSLLSLPLPSPPPHVSKLCPWHLGSDPAPLITFLNRSGEGSLHLVHLLIQSFMAPASGYGTPVSLLVPFLSLGMSFPFII